VDKIWRFVQRYGQGTGPRRLRGSTSAQLLVTKPGMPSRVDRKKSSRRSRNTRRTKFGHGWIPDRPDRRDRCYLPPPKVVRALPSRVDLKEHCPPVYHQGHVNSCTAHAIAAAIQFDERKQSALEKKKRMRRSQIQSRSGQAHMFMPSRLFIYYNGRAMGHSVESDEGAEIRNVLKSVKKRGVCHEALWPYRKRKLRHRPWRKCYTAAAKYPGLTYIHSLEQHGRRRSRSFIGK
jgi:hypothetical protein